MTRYFKMKNNTQREYEIEKKSKNEFCVFCDAGFYWLLMQTSGHYSQSGHNMSIPIVPYGLYDPISYTDPCQIHVRYMPAWAPQQTRHVETMMF